MPGRLIQEFIYHRNLSANGKFDRTEPTPRHPDAVQASDESGAPLTVFPTKNQFTHAPRRVPANAHI